MVTKRENDAIANLHVKDYYYWISTAIQPNHEGSTYSMIKDYGISIAFTLSGMIL